MKTPANRLKQKLDKLEKYLAEKPQESKQVRYQRKQKALGNCVVCGKKSVTGKILYVEHYIKRREWQRKRFGFKPKEAGKPGRTILYHPPLNLPVNGGKQEGKVAGDQ